MAGNGNRGMKSGRSNLPDTTSQKMAMSWMAASDGKPEQCHLGRDSRSRPSAEEPLLLVEVGRPREARRARKVQVGAERDAHGVDESVGATRCEAVFPPHVEHLDAAFVPVDARLDPADETRSEDDRQYVPTPTPLGRRVEQLPHVLEVEEAGEELAIPDQRVEGRGERDGRWRELRGLEQSDLVSQDEPASSNTLDVDRNELACRDQLLAQRRSSGQIRPRLVGLRRAEAGEDIAPRARPQEPMRPVTGEHFLPELLLQRNVARKDPGRYEALEKVVVAPVAISPCEAEDASEGVRLQDSLDGIGRHAEPISGGAAFALEVER